VKQEFKYLREIYVTMGPHLCIETCLLEIVLLVK